MERVRESDVLNGQVINLIPIYDFIGKGQKISAIKELREQSGVDLKTAKDYIDGLDAEQEGMEINHDMSVFPNTVERRMEEQETEPGSRGRHILMFILAALIVLVVFVYFYIFR